MLSFSSAVSQNQCYYEDCIMKKMERANGWECTFNLPVFDTPSLLFEYKNKTKQPPNSLSYYCVADHRNTITNGFISRQTSSLVLALLGLFLDVVMATNCFLQCPFLHSQKFTPLLSIPSILIVFQADSEDDPEGLQGKYAIG